MSVFLREALSFVVLAQDHGNFREAFSIGRVERVEAHVILGHGVGVLIIGCVIPHGTVVHTAFPLGGLQHAAAAYRG